MDANVYPQGRSPWYPLDRRLGGSQNRSGDGGEEKNSQSLPRLEPPIFKPVAQRYIIQKGKFLPWSYIRGPFERFLDWRQCAAVMQREAVTVKPSCSGGGNVEMA
jgi:hypothetical protein